MTRQSANAVIETAHILIKQLGFEEQESLRADSFQTKEKWCLMMEENEIIWGRILKKKSWAKGFISLQIKSKI